MESWYGNASGVRNMDRIICSASLPGLLSQNQLSDSAYTSRVLWYSQRMASNPKRKLTPTWKALIEVAFIIFLFYSNLLMGEFTRANGRGKSLAFALEDIFSVANFGIAIVSGVLGYLGFEYLRKQL